MFAKETKALGRLYLLAEERGREIIEKDSSPPLSKSSLERVHRYIGTFGALTIFYHTVLPSYLHT
jgi:hypothetical protein